MAWLLVGALIAISGSYLAAAARASADRIRYGRSDSDSDWEQAMTRIRQLRPRTAEPDVRLLARERLAALIGHEQEAHPDASPGDLAEAILSSPDVGVGAGLVDTDELGGRHAAVTIWLPLRLFVPIDHEVSP